MFYYDTKDNTGRKYGVAAAVVYLAVWALLMFLVNYRFEEKESGEGVMIAFGTAEEAGGLFDPADLSSATESRRTVSDPARVDEMVMGTDDESPEVEQPRETHPQTNTPQTQTQTRETTTNTPTPERQIDNRTLFRVQGRTQGSTSTSQGAGVGEGNQGSLDGTLGGDPEGTGKGGGGHDFSLEGRSVRGEGLPEPQYQTNEGGRVIVEIRVDPQGRVTSARVVASANTNNGVLRSTTSDPVLRRAAEEAARKAQFNEIDGEGVQVGWITYNFILK